MAAFVLRLLEEDSADRENLIPLDRLELFVSPSELRMGTGTIHVGQRISSWHTG
jgi:hypothetical protein